MLRTRVGRSGEAHAATATGEFRVRSNEHHAPIDLIHLLLLLLLQVNGVTCTRVFVLSSLALAYQPAETGVSTWYGTKSEIETQMDYDFSDETQKRLPLICQAASFSAIASYLLNNQFWFSMRARARCDCMKPAAKTMYDAIAVYCVSVLVSNCLAQSTRVNQKAKATQK